MGNSRGSASRAQKIAAVAAAGVVLLGGASITSLAAWTDNEYVVGGVGDEPGIGTSYYEVEQRTSQNGDTWVQRETPEDANVVDFGLGALALSPGTTVYGWVELRTTSLTDVDGTVTLEGAVDAGGDAALFNALTYGASIIPNAADPANPVCDATSFAAGTSVAAAGSALGDDGANTFDIFATHAVVTVCFAVSLDEDAPDTLMGLQTSPVWNFSSISD